MVIKPYVIFRGPKLDEIHAAYTVIDSCQYKFPIPLLAIDACYKVMKMFHESPSAICNHVWEFLECEGYRSKTEMSAVVATLVEKIRKL